MQESDIVASRHGAEGSDATGAGSQPAGDTLLGDLSALEIVEGVSVVPAEETRECVSVEPAEGTTFDAVEQDQMAPTSSKSKAGFKRSAGFAYDIFLNYRVAAQSHLHIDP